MSELLTFTNDIPVSLLDTNFSDERVCIAARTSTAGASADPKATAGLIRSLMRNRHGSPFEHMSASWQVKAPIFVWREHHRHRIASYNEESGRYKQLEPEFYLPANRPLGQVAGTSAMSYQLEDVSLADAGYVEACMQATSREAYRRYAAMLRRGIAKEVARMVLPVNIMSTCVVTMNARALMNFLSLRVADETAAYPSKPMYEIQQVAKQYEDTLRAHAPITYQAFIESGRVAP